MVLFVSLVLGAMSVGAAGDTAAEHWLIEQVKLTRSIVRSRDLLIEYLVVTPAPKRTLANQARDGSLPEFPGRAVTRSTVRWVDSNQWRLNVDYPNLPAETNQYSDNCEHAEMPWVSSPAQLTVTKKEWGFPERMGNEFARNEILSRTGLLLDGMLTALPGHTRRVLHCEGGEAAFRCTIEDTAGARRYELEVRGAWRPDLGRGFVSQTHVLSATEPSFVGERTAIAGWKPAWEGGPWAAERAEISREGKGPTTIVLVRAEPAPHEALLAACVPPVDGRADAVRGAVTHDTVADYRTRKPQMSYPAMRGASPQSLAPLEGMDRRSAIVAWSLGGGLASILAVAQWLRLRRAARARRASAVHASLITSGRREMA